MCSKTKISCSSETAVLVIGMLSFSAAKKSEKGRKGKSELLQKISENDYSSIVELLDFITHCAKVQKYEQGKIGLRFFDMWC